MCNSLLYRRVKSPKSITAVAAATTVVKKTEKYLRVLKIGLKRKEKKLRLEQDIMNLMGCSTIQYTSCLDNDMSIPLESRINQPF